MNDLKTIRKKLKLTQIEFGERMNVPQSYISEIENGRKNLTSSFIEKIEGEFGIKIEQTNNISDNFISEVNEPIVEYKSQNQVPFYNSQATMTVTDSWPDADTHPIFHATIPGYENCIGLQAFGNSMYPTFQSGCFVLCKEIRDKQLILYGECYVIMTEDHLVIKRLLKSDNENCVIFASDNYKAGDPDRAKYAPFQIEKRKIKKLWIVRGSIKKHQI